MARIENFNQMVVNHIARNKRGILKGNNEPRINKCDKTLEYVRKIEKAALRALMNPAKSLPTA